MSSRSRNKLKKPVRRVSGSIRARPWVTRQLGEDPQLALFWKDGPAQSRRGMLWILSSCEEPTCQCRDVFVEARSVPDNLAVVEMIADEALRILVSPDPKGLAGPATETQACVRIDVDTRAIVPDGKRPQHEELIEWIKAELDEPVMAMLRETWRRAKGKTPEAAPEVTGH